MPRVSVKINTGLQIPSRRRAGLVIYPGKAQEFDVTDEQLVTLLDDQHLEVAEIEATTDAAEGSQDGDNGQGGENTQDEGSEGQEGTKNDAQGDDEGADEGETSTEDSEEAGEGEENAEDQGDQAGDDAAEGSEAEVPAIPSTAAAIKKQTRDIVVAQAQSLGIELDYADDKNVTKAVIADAIIAKQGE